MTQTPLLAIDGERLRSAVVELLAAIGDDPRRDGLVETPRRIAEMYEEIFGGLSIDPAEYLSVGFEVAHDELVILREIPFYSMCEHHFLPFHGEAHVGYIPDGRVVGISKLARVVDVFARRLQVQETMTAQICDAITESLAPMGTAVLIEAVHECMSTRGVHHKDVTTVTTQFTGVFKSDADLRNRFLRMAGHG